MEKRTQWSMGSAPSQKAGSQGSPPSSGIQVSGTGAPRAEVRQSPAGMHISIDTSRIESGASLDKCLDRMCSGDYKEIELSASDIQPMIGEHVQKMPHLMQPPREAIKELQRRANIASQRNEIFFPGGPLHPRFAPKYLDVNHMVKNRGDGVFPQWGGLANFMVTLETFGLALQCLRQPRRVLNPGMSSQDASGDELDTVISPGIWESYKYRIHEISHRFGSGTAMRYDTLFRAQLSHRCAVQDPSVVLSAELTVIDRHICDMAHTASVTSKEAVDAANKASQISAKRGGQKRPASEWLPWRGKGEKKNPKGKGKGKKGPDWLGADWNQYSNLPYHSQQQVMKWGKGGKSPDQAPMMAMPHPGPYVPAWTGTPASGATSRGKWPQL